jgi:hypothetical protein
MGAWAGPARLESAPIGHLSGLSGRRVDAGLWGRSRSACPSDAGGPGPHSAWRPAAARGLVPAAPAEKRSGRAKPRSDASRLPPVPRSRAGAGGSCRTARTPTRSAQAPAGAALASARSPRRRRTGAPSGWVSVGALARSANGPVAAPRMRSGISPQAQESSSCRACAWNCAQTSGRTSRPASKPPAADSTLATTPRVRLQGARVRYSSSSKPRMRFPVAAKGGAPALPRLHPRRPPGDPSSMSSRNSALRLFTSGP